MRQVTDETVLAVGRLTLAAAEIEFVLAWIGGDPAAVFGGPGESLRAAREAATAHRGEFAVLVEAAGGYLAQSHTAVRALWAENGRVDAATFDEISGLLLRCRDRLRELLVDSRQA